MKTIQQAWASFCFPQNVPRSLNPREMRVKGQASPFHLQRRYTLKEVTSVFSQSFPPSLRRESAPVFEGVNSNSVIRNILRFRISMYIREHYTGTGWFNESFSIYHIVHNTLCVSITHKRFGQCNIICVFPQRTNTVSEFHFIYHRWLIWPEIERAWSPHDKYPGACTSQRTTKLQERRRQLRKHINHKSN